MSAYYVIRNNMDNSFAWSNEFGWVDDESYDVFHMSEVHDLNPPIDGRWVPLGEVE